MKNKLVAPVVKWVGGKRQLLSEIEPLFPKRYTTYCEPFVGGGAVLFSKQPRHAIVNDLNKDLITTYLVIRDDVRTLIELLKQYENTADYFYKVRDLDRDKEQYSQLSSVEKAARLLYLNKTCYNGLFRVNSSGEFNSPFGNYKNPNIVNEPVLLAVNKYFCNNDIAFYSEDFASTLKRIKRGAFVYLDPPYDPVSDTSSFTGYNKGGFDERQTNYYTAAGKYLGLIENYQNQNTKEIVFSLTPLARKILSSSYREKQLELIKCILQHKVFNDVMKAYLLYGEMPERSHIINLMKNDSLYNVNSDSTYSRRASTVSGWLNWIVSLCELE